MGHTDLFDLAICDWRMQLRQTQLATRKEGTRQKNAQDRANAQVELGQSLTESQIPDSDSDSGGELPQVASTTGQLQPAVSSGHSPSDCQTVTVTVPAKCPSINHAGHAITHRWATL